VEKKAGKVAFYTINGARLSEIKVGIFPHEMAWSPDRRLLFVTDNGLLWMTDTERALIPFPSSTPRRAGRWAS